MESGIKAPRSGITSHGIGNSSFLRDQGSGCQYHFCGNRGQNLSCFGFKDPKFGCKNGISDENITYLVTNLLGQGA